MNRKRFYVKIQLQLHAITCPGVWLCTHGYLEATVKTLGYYFRTGAMEPHFPLLCHDQFTMEGYFKSLGSMEELERVLAAEQLEITLWQNGRRLAYFLGKMEDVLQKGGMAKFSCAHDINVQLLMKATSAFPGIIAPKVELAAHVGVQDRSPRSSDSIGSSCSQHCNASKFVEPSFELSSTHKNKNRHCQQSTQGGSCFSYLEERRRQRPVCHTRGSYCASPSVGSSQYIHSLSRPQSSTLFEADATLYKNERRRLSTCSSHNSSNSLSFSQISRNSSNCSHSSLSNCAASMAKAKEHQQRCEICLSYRKVFK